MFKTKKKFMINSKLWTIINKTKCIFIMNYKKENKAFFTWKKFSFDIHENFVRVTCKSMFSLNFGI